MDKGQRLAYKEFSFGGSSGSPVFAIAKGIKMVKPTQDGKSINFLTDDSYRDVMFIGINAGHFDNIAPIQ